MSAVNPDRSLSPGWLGKCRPRACIIGLGLIGGSWAGALSHRGWRVTAIERSAESLNLALASGWIEEGLSEIPPKLDVDLVILALPLPLMQSGIAALAGKIEPGAIITDVGSLKMEICRSASLFLGPETFFIGGHPMTGSEKSGFATANPDLFRGYPYVLSPDGCPQAAVEEMVKLVESIGARVVLRQMGRHDLEVAMVSHLPHLLALALTFSAGELSDEQGSALQLAGRSFREITRIVESSPDMWQEIMIKNSDAILSALTLWQTRLNELRVLIENQDGQSIGEAFRIAAKIRQQI